MYLRDVVQIRRGYQTPASYLNFYAWTDKAGAAHRSRAITLAVYMRPGVSDVDPKQETEDNYNLHHLAGQVQDILRAARCVQVVQNDWFEESPEVKLKIAPTARILQD